MLSSPSRSIRGEVGDSRVIGRAGFVHHTDEKSFGDQIRLAINFTLLNHLHQVLPHPLVCVFHFLSIRSNTACRISGKLGVDQRLIFCESLIFQDRRPLEIRYRSSETIAMVLCRLGTLLGYQEYPCRAVESCASRRSDKLAVLQ